MKIPSKIKVGGMVYKVIKDYKFTESELMGQAVHTRNEIRLSKFNQSNEKFDIQKQEECFIHEIMHAIDLIYNEQKLDESIISRLSQGVYQVFKDNKIF